MLPSASLHFWLPDRVPECVPTSSGAGLVRTGLVEGSEGPAGPERWWRRHAVAARGGQPHGALRRPRSDRVMDRRPLRRESLAGTGCFRRARPAKARLVAASGVAIRTWNGSVVRRRQR